MGVNSRIKGANGERELCKLLSGIFSGSFVRSPQSGAIVGGKNLHRRQTLSQTQDRSFRGDIIPPDSLPRLVIEAKSFQEFAFHQLLQPGPCALLDSWIDQAKTASDPDDQWFVAFKITRKSWFIAVPDPSDYVFGNHCAYVSVHGPVRVTELASFFTTNRNAILQKAGPK
jgi:hypothetical protein